MMENKTLARQFRLLAQLMELNGENPFKVKSLTNAAFKIDKMPFPLAGKSLQELETIDGIGKSTAAKVIELTEKGSLQELQTWLAKTPPGIVEMLSIKGIGPKKIAVIWHELGIESIGELYYACNENRLIAAKGFGLKTQEEIKRLIEFNMAANGRFLYARMEGMAKDLQDMLSRWLQVNDPQALLGVSGQFRRQCEIIDELSFVIGTEQKALINHLLPEWEAWTFQPQEPDCWVAQSDMGLRIVLYLCERENFYWSWWKHTGSETHVAAVSRHLAHQNFRSEESIYAAAGMTFVPPELREGREEIAWARASQIPSLITFKELKGSLHNHSTWSDGVHSIDEMALYCREVLKLDYLGLCDHSRSAFYAGGLSVERVREQHQEIDRLNEQLAPFKIFKGIESDILNDGSLDYEKEVLATFDFVVASVHSNLRMDKEKATRRLITAIENPYTTILGHPTGRLLLSRKGYEIDYEQVIDACAANGVVIEINSNPLRLDLDWRWHRYAIDRGVLLSINPDAHRVEGLQDMHYGIMVARKGGVTAINCLNTFSKDEIQAFFQKKRSGASTKI